MESLQNLGAETITNLFVINYWKSKQLVQHKKHSTDSEDTNSLGPKRWRTAIVHVSQFITDSPDRKETQTLTSAAVSREI